MRLSPSRTTLVLATLALAMASIALAQTQKVTLRGYLIDKMCSTRAMKSESPTGAAKKHTKACASMPKCAGSGYGVVSENKFYTFDDKGNEMAKELLNSTKKDDSLSIEVVGTLDGDKITVESLKEAE